MEDRQSFLTISSNDELIFAEENELSILAGEAVPPDQQSTWKVLIADDEVEVHQVTELALSDFTYEGKSLSFMHAYSGQEAKQLIQAHPDTAIILLDVVMETEHAGLAVVQYIREQLGNQLVRIILRTGQPGQAPENVVVTNYGIDDYKTKTELTAQRLFISVVTALRAFTTLMKTIEMSRHLELEIVQRQEQAIALQASETREREKAQALEHSLQQLQQAHLQLVQSEKMSTLGQLVAGIAHEINNPVNFIHGNLTHATQYIQDLLELLTLYQTRDAVPEAAIQAKAEAIDVEFLVEDLPKLLASMQIGTDRIRGIVKSLRIFSRLDEAEVKEVDLHEGIESTLLILDNRLKARGDRPAIQLVKDFGALPLIECYAGQLNQVFMNILSNAIDALEESLHAVDHRFQPLRKETPGGCASDASSGPQIAIRTAVQNEGWVTIRLSDNGTGMPEPVRKRIFEPFFTTKAVGKGTGLGMSISHQIVTEKHHGSLECLSSPGMGTEFIITLPIQQLQATPTALTNG